MVMTVVIIISIIIAMIAAMAVMVTIIPAVIVMMRITAMLVDEFYDRGVMLYISADVPLDSLYSGGTLSFEFKRSYSRLFEM